MKYTLRLDEIKNEELPKVGGKGKNLSLMLNAELPIPMGFVVLTEAYDEFVKMNNLNSSINQVFKEIDPDDILSIEEASNKITDLFLKSNIPKNILSEIAEAYQNLNEIEVAVRSSGTAEDLPGFSFAGQYTSFLNVKGINQILEKVKLCWASLWNSRVIFYRLEKGIEQKPEKISIAVVIQILVKSEKSGIIFTANPLNGRRDQILINASFGLGESIVSGEVTPDHWVIDKKSKNILEEKINRKKWFTELTSDGVIKSELPTNLQINPSLNENEIYRLIELALKTEEFFGVPQDIEWSYADGLFNLVQSRPITSLFPIPEPYDDPESGLKVYAAFTRITQNLTEALTPMGLEYWRVSSVGEYEILRGKVDNFYPKWFKIAAGRSYIDITDIVRTPKRWKKIENFLQVKDPYAGKALVSFLERNMEEITKEKDKFRINIPIIEFGISLLGIYLYSYIYPKGAKHKIVKIGEDLLQEIETDVANLKTIEDRLRYIENKSCELYKKIFYSGYYMAPGAYLSEAVRKKLQNWFGDNKMFDAVMLSLPDNPTTDMGIDLLKISEKLKKDGTCPTLDNPLIKSFLDKYGHRATLELDVGIERWSENPTFIINILKSYMEIDPKEKIAKYKMNVLEAEKAVDQIIELVRKEKGPLKTWQMKIMLYRVRTLGGLRERPKFDMVRILAVFRKMFQDIGKELVQDKRIDDINDVFFVKFKDIESGLMLHEIVRKNKIEYNNFKKIVTIPGFIANTGECIYGISEGSENNILNGTPISPGIYEGKARIIYDPRKEKLKHGEIIVAYSTDPSWTPLFLNAGALVMETGGPISHGAIVAREYGIPAVAGIDISKKIISGQNIRVNGDSGQIVLLD